jgi:hypothetical protein
MSPLRLIVLGLGLRFLGRALEEKQAAKLEAALFDFVDSVAKAALDVIDVRDKGQAREKTRSVVARTTAYNPDSEIKAFNMEIVDFIYDSAELSEEELVRAIRAKARKLAESWMRRC